MTDSNKLRAYIEILDEASLKDIASSAGQKLKALSGDEKAQGAEESARLAKFLTKKYNNYLGKIGKDADEETLMNFLVSKVGFTAANARKIFAEVGIQDPTKKTEAIELVEALDPALINKAMNAAAAFAYKYDLVDDPNDQTGIKKNQSKSDSSFGSSRRRNKNSTDDLVDQIKGMDKSSKNNQQSTQGQANNPGNANNYAIDKFAFLDAIRATGLSRRHLGDLADIARNSKSFDDIKGRPDMAQFAAIGYAVFKAQQKHKP